MQRTINRVLAHVGLRVVFLLAWLRRRSHAQVEAVTALELRVQAWTTRCWMRARGQVIRTNEVEQWERARQERVAKTIRG